MIVAKPTKALMTTLQRFVFRHEIFVEAREFDDGLIFVREPKGRARKRGPRRNFEVFLRREKRRVHFYTMTMSCRSADERDWRGSIDFPEKVLLRAAEAALDTITPTRFVNTYSYGSFKGNASEWMAKYFDVPLSRANWGTREFMLRLPARVLALDTAQRYCVSDAASARATGDHVILEFRSDAEEGGEWIGEENGTLASVLPLRADLAGGDLRVLYLAWLRSAQLGELDDTDDEPSCPPGLGTLSAPLEAFVDVMRIDRDLIDVAAAASPDLVAPDDAALPRWVAARPESEQTALLVRRIGGAEAHLHAELLRRVRESRAAEASPAKARTGGELRKPAEERAEERRRQKAEHTAREKARRERDAAAARARHLAALATRESEAWRELDALIATKQPKKYDEAVALLGDLRDVCVRGGRQGEAATRIARLREEHTKKPSLIDRFRQAGLTRSARS